MQATPGPLQLLEVGVVHDHVDLFGKLEVELGDDRFDRLDDVGTDQLGLRKGLFRKGPYSLLNRTFGLVRFRLEFLLQ